MSSGNAASSFFQESMVVMAMPASGPLSGHRHPRAPDGGMAAKLLGKYRKMGEGTFPANIAVIAALSSQALTG